MAIVSKVLQNKGLDVMEIGIDLLPFAWRERGKNEGR